MIYIIWVYQEVYETVGHTFIQALQVTFGSPKKKALVICQNIGNWCENESTISGDTENSVVWQQFLSIFSKI